MKRVPQTPEVRTPTSAWAGLALSKTSPFALGDGMSQLSLREKLTPFDKASTTGFIDSMPASMNRIPLSDFKDIHSLLTYLKLEHYISKYTHRFCFVFRLVNKQTLFAGKFFLQRLK